MSCLHYIWLRYDNRGPMSISQQFRRNVRIFYGWVFSTIALGVSPLVGLWLIEKGTTTSRIAGVVVGVGGMLPWIWVLTIIIRAGDEFVRRMHLFAIAIATRCIRRTNSS